MHWASWDFLSRPKVEGGLDFRWLVLFNKAYLQRALEDDTIARVNGRLSFFSKVLSKCGHYGCTTRWQSLYIWRSLCWSRDALEQGLLWRTGDGAPVWAYKDAWVLGLPSSRITSRQGLCSNSRVARFIAHDRSWDANVINETFLPYEAIAILRIPLATTAQHDE